MNNPIRPIVKCVNLPSKEVPCLFNINSSHMRKSTLYLVACMTATVLLNACQPKQNLDLKNALTFFASFDNGFDADYALGDKNIYTATSRRALDSAMKGMHNADHKIVKDQGQYGDALRFGSRTDTVIFFRGKNNIVYDPQNWSGSISFWLSLDPATDLEPGYTDPIQITDSRWNDAAIWVDFTRENPRDFRLGVIGDMTEWSKDTIDSPVEVVLEKRRVTVKNPPFTKTNWTHIAITYQSLGGNQSMSTLFINGEKIGTISGVNDPFTWELDNANIYLGLGFIGSMDEVAIFNRPLSDEEIISVYQLADGIGSIL